MISGSFFDNISFCILSTPSVKNLASKLSVESSCSVLVNNITNIE